MRPRAVLSWLPAALLATAAALAPPALAQDLAAPPPAAAPPPYFGQGSSWDAGEPARRVAVFGDSLVRQSSSLLTSFAATRSAALDVWGVSGAAPCDLLPSYGERMRAHGTERVELAFVGNATTDCMTSRIGGRPRGVLTPAARARIASVYAADLATLIRWNRASGVVTYLVLPPAMAPATWHGQLTPALTAAYTRLAAAQPEWVRLNTGVHDTLTPQGVYQPLVVLNGRPARLRHTDGTHLAAPLGTTAHASALLWPLLLEP